MNKLKLYELIMMDVSRKVKSLLNETSINAKKRNMNNAINVYKMGKSGYNNIKTFGIVSAMNPDSIQVSAKVNSKNMKSLANTLKDAHFGFVKQRGHFAGNDEYSYFIFNISLNTLMHYDGQYEQTSFFYCELIDGEVVSSYYEKEDTTLPYNKRTNPYVCVELAKGYIDASDADNYSELGGKFKYTIPLKCFESVNEVIENNLTTFNHKDTIVESTINQVGLHPWFVRQKLYKTLF